MTYSIHGVGFVSVGRREGYIYIYRVGPYMVYGFSMFGITSILPRVGSVS